MKTAALMKMRFGYLGLPPWSFARCGTIQGARDFMEHVRSVDMQEHDPVTRELADELGAHIDDRAAGSEVHPIAEGGARSLQRLRPRRERWGGLPQVDNLGKNEQQAALPTI